MSALWSRWLAALADLPPARRVLEALLAVDCRRHLSRLDHTPADRLQLRALLAIVRRARATPFGRDHDFGRIRTAADFRRLVPLRTPRDMAREYGLPGAACPSRTAESPLRGRGRAVLTALALALRDRPQMRLLDGQVLWLGDDAIRGQLPAALRCAVRARATEARASVVIGSREDVAAFLERSSHGAPELAIVLSTRAGERAAGFPPAGASPSAPRSLPQIIELLSLPEAPLAVADARLGGMRLLVDHEGYFEFLPAQRAGDPDPPRLGLGEVRLGVDYEAVVTSRAGARAQRSGVLLRFERLAPPVVRVLATPAPEATALAPLVRSDAPAAPPPAPHRRSAGSPAAPPGTPFHSLWSARADRG